MAHKPC